MIGAVVLSLTTFSASAQPIPAGAAVGRQTLTGATDTALRGTQRRADTERPEEKKRQEPLAADLEKAAEKDEKPTSAEATAKILVTTIDFIGNTVVSKAELKPLARPYEHRQVSLAQLGDLCLKIRDAYRARGYILARAGVPPQQVKGGHVRIAISEGRYGKVKITGNEHYSDEFIRGFFDVAMRDPVVKKDRVERALLLLNSFTDLSVKSVFDIGKKPGTTDVELKVQDEAPFHYGFDYNNYGNALVGRNRAGLAIWGGNVSVFGDELYVHVTDSFPGKSPLWYQLQYTMPIDTSGDRLTAGYTLAETRVGGAFEILDIRGTAQIGNVQLSHPLERTTKETTNLNAGIVVKNVDNFIFNSVPVSKDRLREFTLSFDGNWVTDAGRLVFTGLITQGLGAIGGGTPNGDPLSSRPGAGAGDGFTKLNLDLAHLTQFSKDFFGFFRIDAQGSNKPLTTPEQYALGGADSVRGFMQSEFLADDGGSASAELRANFWDADLFHMQGVGFIDAGSGSIKRPIPGEVISRTLVGAGAGVRFTYSNTISGRVDVGFPVHGKVAADSSSVIYGQIISKF